MNAIYQTRIEIEENDEEWKAAVRVYSSEAPISFSHGFNTLEEATEWAKKLALLLDGNTEVSF